MYRLRFGKQQLRLRLHPFRLLNQLPTQFFAPLSFLMSRLRCAAVHMVFKKCIFTVSLFLSGYGGYLVKKWIHTVCSSKSFIASCHLRLKLWFDILSCFYNYLTYSTNNQDEQRIDYARNQGGDIKWWRKR